MWLSLLLAAKLMAADIVVETKKVPGSSFEEVHVTTRSPLGVPTLCAAVWGEGDMKTPEPGFKLRRVLKESKDERWTYEQIAAPVVSDRDYTMYAKRYTDEGLCQVTFETRNGDGPPPDPKHVRIPKITGSWTLEASDGGTLITYVIYSEPGGGIPAWMARGAQKDGAVKWMKQILARATPDKR